MRATLALAAVLNLAFAAGARADADTDPHQASAVFVRQMDVIRAMNRLYPSVQVDVRWMPCGTENSAYIPAAKTIVLCTEMEAHPSVALVFAAHEFGHAITEQLTNTGDEQSADEIAALSLISLGYRQELLDTAVFMAGLPDQGHEEGDEHPSNGFRAWEFACLETGSEPDSAFKSDEDYDCRNLYNGLVVRWTHRLAQP